MFCDYGLVKKASDECEKLRDKYNGDLRAVYAELDNELKRIVSLGESLSGEAFEKHAKTTSERSDVLEMARKRVAEDLVVLSMHESGWRGNDEGLWVGSSDEELLELIAKALALEGGEATPGKRETLRWMLSQKKHCDALLKHFVTKSNELLEENQKLKTELEEAKRTMDNYWQHIVWTRTSEDMKPKTAPCPICGSAHVGLEGSVCSREFFVWCLDCGAMGPAQPSESAAILAWNKGEGVTRDDDIEEEPDADERDILAEIVAFVKEHTVLEAYAHVWNTLISAPSADVAEALMPLFDELERKVAFEHLEEYCWERDDNNTWRYVDGAEFCARIRAEREEKE